MIGLIDTNILIYGSVASTNEHRAAKAFLARVLQGRDTYALTWINIAEYLSFTTQPFAGAPAPLAFVEARDNMQLLLSAPTIRLVTEGEAHWEHFCRITDTAGVVRGPFVYDCRIAAIMRENGIDTIFTRDTEFRKIPHLTVIDPL